MMLVPILVGLTALTLLLMVGLGDGTRSRTQTRTAADAAALAAASAWSHDLEDRYQRVVDQDPGWQESLLDLIAPDSPATHALGDGPKQAAALFAERNDAEIRDFQAVTIGEIMWWVQTRSLKPAQISEVRTEGTATASIRLLGGLCYPDPLGPTRFGFLVDDRCVDPWDGHPPSTRPTALPPSLPPLSELEQFRAEPELIQ